MSRAGAALVVALVGAGCSGGSVHTTPTSLPPTTITSTPISPPGVADTARRWVATLAAKQEAPAFAVLAPASQAIIGGQARFGAVAGRLEQQWADWANTPTAEFDAVPIADGLAVVIISAETKEKDLIGAALPMRVVGGEWRPDPLETVGSYRFDPGDRSRVTADSAISIDVEAGVQVDAFVDAHVAAAEAPKQAGASTQRIRFKPQRQFDAGWHLVTVVLRKGDAVTAVTSRYQVAAK